MIQSISKCERLFSTKWCTCILSQNRWKIFGRKSAIEYPVRSTDLTPLNFFVGPKDKLSFDDF